MKKLWHLHLVQGGLEITIKVSVTWAAAEKLSILAARVKEVEYPLTGEYIDDSKSILKELGVEEDEDDDEDVEPQTGDVDDADDEDIQIL